MEKFLLDDYVIRCDFISKWLEKGRYSMTIILLMLKAINSIINNIGGKDRENKFLLSVIHQR